MNDELSPSDVVVPEPDIEETPTRPEPPKPVPSGVWAMPEPVFKKTSGYLPQGFNQPFDPLRQGDENTTVEQPKPDLDEESHAAPEPATVPEVEPQPDVLAEIGAEFDISPVPASPPQKKGGLGRVLMVLLALLIVVLMIAVVVGVVWFVLLPTPDATFN